MADYTAKDVERFWSKVDLAKVDEEFACWEWTAYTNKSGYGTTWWRGHMKLAHRAVYELAFGEPPADLCVLHHCDRPSCCNPNHMFLGTNADNVRDKVQKGRQFSPRGERHGSCKLSDALVAVIRQRYAQGGISQRQLAREFDVHQSQVWRIVNHKRR